MKKLLLSLVLLVSVSSVLSAFYSREHAAITLIAERYLSHKAEKAISEITDGQKLTMFASHPDKFRSNYLYDGHQIPHLFTVDADFKPGNDPEKDCTAIIQIAFDALKDGRYKTISRDSSMIYLSYLVHFVGDMHCPSHIRYPEDLQQACPGSYIIKDMQCGFHKAWDTSFSEYSFTGGPYDLSLLADIAGNAERKAYQQGTVEDWASDVARSCFEQTRSDKFNEKKIAKLDNLTAQKHGELVKDEVMKAGYRLAALLNALFK